MLIRQTKNTFIRIWGGKGYIVNQLTKQDRLYNETGADFLQQISREAKDVNNIIKNLLDLYGDSVNLEKLKQDFLNFILDLEKYLFVVIGETELECNEKDIDFSYSLGNMKNTMWDFTQVTGQSVDATTKDYFLNEDKVTPRLKSIQFELTSRCNERCIHCYIPNGKKDLGHDMTYEQVCNVVNQFVDMGGLHITLSGGEVFLHKDLIHILQYCRKKDMEICILSNLMALQDWQINILKEVNLSYIQVSLYSMNPEVHDAITTIKGSQVKTKIAIEKLIAANVPLQISCPLMKANKDSYNEVLAYAQSLHIKAFSDYIMMAESDFNTENLKNRLSIQQTEKVIRNIIEFDKDYSRWIERQHSVLENLDINEYSKQPLCGVGINSLCIAENGDVYPCPGWQSLIVGNVFKQDLKDIWENSEALLALRKVTRSDFPECLKCDAQKYCSMCLERNYNENKGDMFKVNRHFCEVAFLTKRLHDEYRGKGVL